MSDAEKLAKITELVNLHRNYINFAHVGDEHWAPSDNQYDAFEDGENYLAQRIRNIINDVRDEDVPRNPDGYYEDEDDEGDWDEDDEEDDEEDD